MNLTKAQKELIEKINGGMKLYRDEVSAMFNANPFGMTNGDFYIKPNLKTVENLIHKGALDIDCYSDNKTYFKVIEL